MTGSRRASLSALEQLDGLLEQVIRHLAVIADTQIEFEFQFDGALADENGDQATGYKSLCYGLAGLIEIRISDDGDIVDQPNPQNLASCITTITAPVEVHLSEIIHTAVLADPSSHYAWLEQYFLGFRAVFQLEHEYEFSLCSLLNQGMKALALDEVTKARLEGHAVQIIKELSAFEPWLKLAADLAILDLDAFQREELATNIKLVLEKLSDGTLFNVEKIRVLCMIANSLQPVLSIIQRPCLSADQRPV